MAGASGAADAMRDRRITLKKSCGRPASLDVTLEIGLPVSGGWRARQAWGEPLKYSSKSPEAAQGASKSRDALAGRRALS